MRTSRARGHAAMNERRLIRGTGGQGRNRTTDTRIFSPLLYQLSYLATRASKDSARHARERSMRTANLRAPRGHRGCELYVNSNGRTDASRTPLLLRKGRRSSDRLGNAMHLPPGSGSFPVAVNVPGYGDQLGKMGPTARCRSPNAAQQFHLDDRMRRLGENCAQAPSPVEGGGRNLSPAATRV